MSLIVISGHTQCEVFSQITIVVDFLSQHLPNFCYERIVKPVIEWKTWLMQVNNKYKWHHLKSPIVWKELSFRGGRAYYIGGASAFWDYLYSYYGFDFLMANSKLRNILENGKQYLNKKKYLINEEKTSPPAPMVICISGAAHPIVPDILVSLLDITAVGSDIFLKIYLYDEHCPVGYLEDLENDCNYVETESPTRVVKAISVLGIGLKDCDLLIVLDHVPFNEEVYNSKTIYPWLMENCEEILKLADYVNACSSPFMKIIFPNLGPCCFNATCLAHAMVAVKRSNIVVATDDLGLEALYPASKIVNIPLRNIFCPPVWGLVGINHIVDLRTTVHKYNMFQPYKRHEKVKNSTLKIGAVVPELRTLEYLIHWDKTLWLKVSERQKMAAHCKVPINKAVAVLGVIKAWICSSKEYNSIVNLGVMCNGTFGLKTDYVLSQAARLTNKGWRPAAPAGLPRDPHLTLHYLEAITEEIFRQVKMHSQLLSPKHASRMIHPIKGFSVCTIYD